MLNVIPIKAFTDNYIWLITDKDSNRAVAVDPGAAKPIISYCLRNKLQLSAILITHHHSDHTAGLPELASYYENLVIYGPKTASIPNITNIVHDECDISLLDKITVSVISSPGHTLDHIMFYIDKETNPNYVSDSLLFCGDTLFSCGCGRLFEGTPKQMWQSLSKICNLQQDVQIYCAHEYTSDNTKFALCVEPNNKKLAAYCLKVNALLNEDKGTLPTSLKLEREVNPFLRTHSQEIIDSVQRRINKKVTSELQLFTELRSWKDNF